jgi:hypothetical protein
MIDYLNHNAGAVTALTTIALLLVTGWYAWTTRALLRETRQSRLMAGEPRVVAYLRVHEVHTNLVQLCVANLSRAAAVGVTASLKKVTEWPEPFDLQDSRVLRDLKFMRPNEVLRFDLGAGPELFRGEETAVFEAHIDFQSLDGRKFSFDDTLTVESVTGHGNWRIYGIDDVARHLDKISQTLKGFTGFQRLRVETYDAHDRDEEDRQREAQRERYQQQHAPSENTDPNGNANPPEAA